MMEDYIEYSKAKSALLREKRRREELLSKNYWLGVKILFLERTMQEMCEMVKNGVSYEEILQFAEQALIRESPPTHIMLEYATAIMGQKIGQFKGYSSPEWYEQRMDPFNMDPFNNEHKEKE